MGSAPQACLTEAASSPVQSCLLFSVMKINETVQSSAEATGALLTEEAFRLRQPFTACYHGTSERGREGASVREKAAAQCCSRMTMGNGRDRCLLMQNANDSGAAFVCCIQTTGIEVMYAKIRFS